MQLHILSPLIFQKLQNLHGVNLNIIAELVIISGALGRAIAPISASVIMGAKVGNINLTDIIKKNIIPVISGYSIILIYSLIVM